jgi:hypothetical protein
MDSTTVRARVICGYVAPTTRRVAGARRICHRSSPAGRACSPRRGDLTLGRYGGHPSLVKEARWVATRSSPAGRAKGGGPELCEFEPIDEVAAGNRPHPSRGIAPCRSEEPSGSVSTLLACVESQLAGLSRPIALMRYSGDRLTRSRSRFCVAKKTIEGSTVKIAAIRHNGANPLCVTYVFKRIEVEQHKISQFAGFDRSQ